MPLCTRCRAAEAALSIATAADARTAEALCMICSGKRVAESDTDFQSQIARLIYERDTIDLGTQRNNERVIVIQAEIDRLKAGSATPPPPKP